mgnify:CR=1 FL=1
MGNEIKSCVRGGRATNFMKIKPSPDEMAKPRVEYSSRIPQEGTVSGFNQLKREAAISVDHTTIWIPKKVRVYEDAMSDQYRLIVVDHSTKRTKYLILLTENRMSDGNYPVRLSKQ